MPEGPKQHPLFTGMVFWGSELLPKDVTISLDSIRQWALKQKLIWDEAQLITLERIDILREHFVPQDGLAILINLYTDSAGKLNYLELPYIPGRTLIKKAVQIQMIYWQMVPTVWSGDGTLTDYGEVRFGFWYPKIEGEEFASTSTGRLVVQKFNSFLGHLSEGYERKVLSSGILDIQVNGNVRAEFFKTGRLFDVELVLS